MQSSACIRQTSTQNENHDDAAAWGAASDSMHKGALIILKSLRVAQRVVFEKSGSTAFG